MNRLRILALAMCAASLAYGKDGADERNKPSHAAASAPVAGAVTWVVPTVRTTPGQVPKVLQGHEPSDSGVVTLPGVIVPRRTDALAPVPRPAPKLVLVAPDWHPKGVPALPPAPEVALALPAASSLTWLTSVVEVPPPPATPAGEPRPIKSFPPLLAEESAVFCQKEIGRWTLPEARTILGEPHRQRPAVDDDSVENGHIYAFKDPTNRYKELELDFDKQSGILRSVFIYPWNLTWQECRKLWGSNFSATEGNKGRTFYSYVNRHLDVLVDRDGKVISLGLY